MLLTSAAACDLWQLVATLSGCKTTTSAVMVHCLRQKTEEELMETSQKLVSVSILYSSGHHSVCLTLVFICSAVILSSTDCMGQCIVRRDTYPQPKSSKVTGY